MVASTFHTGSCHCAHQNPFLFPLFFPPVSNLFHLKKEEKPIFARAAQAACATSAAPRNMEAGKGKGSPICSTGQRSPSADVLKKIRGMRAPGEKENLSQFPPAGPGCFHGHLSCLSARRELILRAEPAHWFRKAAKSRIHSSSGSPGPHRTGIKICFMGKLEVHRGSYSPARHCPPKMVRRTQKAMATRGCLSNGGDAKISDEGSCLHS